MRGLGRVWVCLALIACLLAVPVSAAGETVVDEDIDLWIDTSQQTTTVTFSGASYSDDAYSMNILEIADISKFQTLNYVVIEVDRDGSFAEGRTVGTYSFGGASHDYAVDTVKSRNLLGQVTKTRFTIWLYDWSIGTKTGAQNIVLDKPLWTGSKGYYYHSTTDSKMTLRSSTGRTPYPSTPYKITYCSGIRWRNHLTVSEEFVSTYQVTLQRVFSDSGYYSTISASNSAGTQTFTNSANTNFSTYALKADAAKISVVSPTKTYEFPLAAETPETPIDQAKFSLSLSPENGIGSPITATLTPATDAPAYDYINWQYLDPGSPYETTFQKISGTWKKYNPETQAYDIAVTGTEYLTPTFTPTQAGYTYIACQVYDLAGKKKVADLIEYVTVSDKMTSDKFPVDLQVFDADTGGGLLRVNLDVKNLQTGETTSTLIQTESVGYRLMLQVGSTYDLTVSKSGYESRTFTRVGSTTKTLTARLPKSVSSDPEKVWMYFYVLDGSQAPISGAAVQLSGLSTTLTNSQGLAKIAVSTNTTYQYTVSQTDYTGVSDEIIIESTSQWKYVTLTPTGAAVTSPVPTGPGTVTTPDYRSIDEKATSALSILFDHVELFAALAGLVLLCNMLFWIVPGGGRR